MQLIDRNKPIIVKSEDNPVTEHDRTSDDYNAVTIENLFDKINGCDMQKIAKDARLKRKLDKKSKNVSIGFAILGTVAAIAAIVGAIALIFFTGGTTAIIIGSVVGIVGSIGGLSFPVITLLSSISKKINGKEKQEDLFKQIQRVKELVNKRLKFAEKLGKDELDRQIDINRQRNSANTILEKAREIFPDVILESNALDPI